MSQSLHNMTQEHLSQGNNVQASEKVIVHMVGMSGWRKRCLYFFLLLLMILILVNLALTIWILKVMNFTIEGMGHLRITPTGLELQGDSEFMQPLYAKEIQSRPGRPLFLQSSRNVSINILDGKNMAITQLVAGSNGVRACSKLLEVKSNSGKLLFSADDQEVVVGADRLRVPGAEGAVFSRSVETPHVRAEPFKELRSGPPEPSAVCRKGLSQTGFWVQIGSCKRVNAVCSRLESPTRSLIMEGSKGVRLLAEAGDIQATCRNDMRLESKDGQIILNASKIKLLRLPRGQSAAGPRQVVFEWSAFGGQQVSHSAEELPSCPCSRSPAQRMEVKTVLL
ncbi:hypothetical protein AAFF_G00046590 [Aldrovandia affinis]|uniref:Delta-sarcoglycan n=1 Tax=Aldrovandia affinis TaxID=143900 RepID=A0AAD7S203_9TELE|nr:hypothetical protein AAFF_G00046590 [Aldrovandia affinis]